jgi:imidazolonepropionase-like amidohydrolase
VNTLGIPAQCKQLLAGILLLLYSVAVTAQGLVLTPVKVVNINSGEILPRQAVLIKDGRIAEIISASEIVDEQFTRIDGKHGYLIPGLTEMHAHVPGKRKGEQYTRDILTLFLANGVTTIRGMLGEAWHLYLRDKLEVQKWPGPRLITSGPSFNGNSVTSPEQAAERVRQQKTAGYDFLKLHPGLKADEFAAIAQTAKSLQIPLAGHVSYEVGLAAALTAQQATIDHLDGYAQEMVPPASDMQDVPPAFFGVNLAPALDASLAGDLAQRTVAAGVWNVVTQSLLENIYGDQSIESLLARPGMKYIGPSLQQSWVKSVKRARSEITIDDRKRFIEARRRLIYELQQAGAGLLLGSDAPQIMNVPGFSIHEELGFLVAAGLTPLQALQTGTIRTAQFFGFQDQGSIRAGMQADLVLLRDNPLENIQATADIQGVMRGGTWYPASQLASMLAAVANRGL